MYIFSQGMEQMTVLVVGYDPMGDSEWEWCAVFQALPEEHKVRLLERYRRSHMKPENCELIGEIEPEDVALFEKQLPRFYKEAMRHFKLTPIDDSFPAEQQEMPFLKKP